MIGILPFPILGRSLIALEYYKMIVLCSLWASRAKSWQKFLQDLIIRVKLEKSESQEIIIR